MNEIDVYGIVSQGLNIANQKGAFNLDESAAIAQALFEFSQTEEGEEFLIQLKAISE